MIIQHPQKIKEFLRKHQHEMDTPQAYLGTEPNTHNKDWNDSKIKLRILFAAPWRYEDFRGNQTVPLLYQMLNSREDVLCDRAFFPNTEKDYKLFRKYRIPIFGLETRRSMGEYDLIMTTLSFLPPWVNFPLMLELSGIPSFWWERDGRKFPLIMVGGSSMYGNFSIAYPVVNMVYLGDAEPGLDAVLDYLIVHRFSTQEAGILNSLQEEFDYVFVPGCHVPVYHEEKFVHWMTKERDAYKKLKIIRQDKLDDAPLLTKPIPSFTDTTMGLGEIEISRGCRAFCAFCGIGWKYKPYRERSREVLVPAFKENKRVSGATALCPIATEFAYYSEKKALIKDLCMVSHTVDPLSMRIDAFIEDENFDSLLADRGMNQLALGVEAPSQRLRNRLQKGITEEQILKACKIALRKGFRRFKFFMISNIDETWEDFEEFFNLIRKIRAMEVSYKKNKIRTGWNIGIICSWTPLFVEPCTPFQWKKPTIEQRQRWKEVDEILRGELKCKFKLGIKNAEDFLWTMQGMHLGDTRFAESLVHATLHLKRPFYVSFTKSMKKQLTKEFKRTGYEWSYLLRERGEDEEFPWDIVDRGVTKKALRNVYNKIVSGEADKKPMRISPTLEDCSFAGVPKRHPEVDGQYTYILGYQTPDEYDVVPNTHFRALFHRAAYLAGFPLAVNSMRFFSDRDARNWYGGIDEFIIRTQRPVTVDEILSLNKYLSPGMRVCTSGSLGDKYDWKSYFGEYTVMADVSVAEVIYSIEQLKEKKIVEVAIPSTRYFSGTFSKKKLDIKAEGVYHKVEVRGFIGRTAIAVELGSEVGIRYFLQALFPHIAFSRILQFNVKKYGVSNDSKMGDIIQTEPI